MKFRAFISFDIGTREELVRVLDELRGTKASLKLVRPELMHVTIKFLGDIDESRVPDIEAAMRRAVDGVHPFTVRLRGLGAFPSARKARVVWVGMEGTDPLAGIASRLEAELAAMGFEPERRGFSPHLTLARVRGGGRLEGLAELIEEHRDADLGSIEIRSIRLKRSILSPAGPSYSTMVDVKLPVSER
jgi:2'-5' RNA ligase